MTRTRQKKAPSRSSAARRMKRAIRVMERLGIDKVEQVQPHVWRIQLGKRRQRRLN